MLKINSGSYARFARLTAAAAVLVFAVSIAAAAPVHFKITLDASAAGSAAEPLSGRLLIFMRKDNGKPSEGFDPDFTDPNAVWISGTEVSNVEAGKPFDIDADATAFPSGFSAAPAGDYQVFALLDRDHSYTYDGTGPGDILSCGR